MKSGLCNLCGENNFKVWLKGYDRRYSTPGSFVLVECKNCHFTYLYPVPDKKKIESFYPENYSPHFPKLRAKLNNKNIIKKFKKVIKSFFYFFKLPLNIRDIYPKIYNSISRETRILDVGCGRGDFLYKLKKERDCQIFGLDISPIAVKWARQILGDSIFQGDLLDQPFNGKFFDIVTGWWYLEHVRNPTEVLQEINRILRPNGLVIIGVPNRGSFLARVFKNKWYHLDIPRHLSHFMPKTIKAVLKKTNFKIIKIFYDTSTWGLIGSLKYLIFGNYVKGYPHWVKKFFDILDKFLRPLCILLAIFKLSDIMVIYAKKR